jgi:long-chain acyl-CoA synthetase
LVVLREPWSVDNNKMTPTLKIKRNVIEKEFGPKLENWFENAEVLVWE